MELFEKGKDINKEKVNIKEAVDYLADAWKNITDEPIFNYWVKTGILPSITKENMTDVMQIQQDILNDEIEDIDQMIKDFLIILLLLY